MNQQIKKFLDLLNINNLGQALPAIAGIVTVIIALIGGLVGVNTSSNNGFQGSSNTETPVTTPAEPTDDPAEPTESETPAATPFPAEEVGFSALPSEFAFKQLESPVTYNGEAATDAWVPANPEVDAEAWSENPAAAKFWTAEPAFYFNNPKEDDKSKYSEFTATIAFMDNAPVSRPTEVKIFVDDEEIKLNKEDYVGFNFNDEGRIELFSNSDPLNLKLDIKDASRVSVEFQGYSVDKADESETIGLMLLNAAVK